MFKWFWKLGVTPSLVCFLHVKVEGGRHEEVEGVRRVMCVRELERER